MFDGIEIYTDGSSRGNPGPGGFGVLMRYKGVVKEISGGFRKTTNNRMELLAVITGLEAIKNKELPVKVYSDSKYVIDSITKRWVYGWLKKGFAGKKNKDLWLRYLNAEKGLKITFEWVRGHNGHIENERCDVLAVNAAMDKSNHAIDSAFELEESGQNLAGF